MKQIAKKIPLAVARTNIWDPQSPPRSMQFGAFTPRGVGITRCTWEEPELVKALHKVAEFRPKHLLPAYLTISLNEYTTLKLHVDKHNRSSSIVIAFGDFTGGELRIEREGREYHPGRVDSLTIEHWSQLAGLEETLVNLAAASLPTKSDQVLTVLLKKLDDILYKSTKLPVIKGETPLEIAKLEAHERFGHFPKDPDCPACQMESGTKVDHPRVHSWEYNTLYVDTAKMDVESMNGCSFFVVMALRLKGPKNEPVLLPWYVPVPSKGGHDVTLACFEIINRIPFIKPLRPYDARVLRIFSDQGTEYINKVFGILYSEVKLCTWALQWSKVP
eukprot:1036038-Amphidinium_carterae.1